MKYIRTKDKLLIAPDLYDNGGVVLCSDPPKYETRNAKNEWGCVDVSEVIKIANTIEELCDEFVRVSKSIHDFLVSDDIPTKKFDDTEIYGAIWTDKGLVYVAKINDKGELELL